MKNIYKILVSVIGVFLFGCYSGNDDYKLVSLRIQDAFAIENEGNYVVGDTIFFELNFSRYLPEPGYSNLLDIYESTDAIDFNYGFDLRKFSSLSNDYVYVAIDPSFVFAEKGKVFESFNQGTATLNEDQDRYESRVGIILVETGDFRFDFENPYIRSQYMADKVYLEIRHEFSTSSTINLEFIVTE